MSPGCEQCKTRAAAERLLRPKELAAILRKATSYVYAMRQHGSQKRASGDPYFAHPIEVAGILTD